MFELIFLGTSASAPSVHRGLSSTAVLTDQDRYLVDCGEGTQRQILQAGMGFRRLNRVLLTHPHLDHLLGLGGLVSTFARWETVPHLDIWGSHATLERVKSLIYDVVLRDQEPRIPITLTPVTGQGGLLVETKHYSISAFPVVHRGRGCYGYIFQERDHRPFLAEQADALGVPHNAERARLVRGESISLADGRVITPEMVLGETVKGTKLVFTGDTARTDTLRPYVDDADVLVTEATFLERDREMAAAYGHITAYQAGVLAREANVKHLLLTHISRRYSEREMIQEAQRAFEQAYVVRDFDHFRVGRSLPLQKVVRDPNQPIDMLDEDMPF